MRIEELEAFNDGYRSAMLFEKDTAHATDRQIIGDHLLTVPLAAAPASAEPEMQSYKAMGEQILAAVKGYVKRSIDDLVARQLHPLSSRLAAIETRFAALSLLLPNSRVEALNAVEQRVAALEELLAELKARK
jgi:hypothetical protein